MREALGKWVVYVARGDDLVLSYHNTNAADHMTAMHWNKYDSVPTANAVQSQGGAMHRVVCKP